MDIGEFKGGEAEKALAKSHITLQRKQTTTIKRSVLTEYEEKYGNGTTFQQQGEKKMVPTRLPTVRQAIFRSTMKPSIAMAYRVEDLYLPNVLFPVLKEYGGSLSAIDWWNLSLVRKEYMTYVPGILRLLSIDFMPLLQPRIG